jgi:endonuclease YncB( thermonuclease family)
MGQRRVSHGIQGGWTERTVDALLPCTPEVGGGPVLRRVLGFFMVAVLAGCGRAPAVSDGASAATARPPASAGSAAISTASAVPSVSLSPHASPALGTGPVGPTTLAQVVRVVDGDTIKVSIDGTEYTVRYIGMDTPETVKPGTPVQWMGPEASAANKALVEGQQVVLEKDVSEVDRYGRLLRDVWLDRPEGWLLVNVELVRLGFASVSTYPPDVAYESVLLDAQREAREADRGLWAATPAPSVSPGSTGACDPAYPTVCIPPPPPDLDCADITFRRFEVLAPDPHNFDGDHNGIGCES